MKTKEMNDESCSNPDLREIYLVGGINDEAAHQLITSLRTLDAKRGPIHVVIASNGGDEGAGWAIYDALKLARNEIRIEAFGSCQSISMLILQAAKLRLLSPDCRLMIHNGSIEVAATVSQMRSMGPEVEFLTQRYYEVLAERSGQSIKTIRKWCDEEKYMSSEEACQEGLADGIIILPPKKGKKK